MGTQNKREFRMVPASRKSIKQNQSDLSYLKINQLLLEYIVDTVQDFLIKLGIKPCIYGK